jgi:hypothetical protein
MFLKAGLRIMDENGATASATYATYLISGDPGLARGMMNVSYTGGDGTTSVVWHLETSPDAHADADRWYTAIKLTLNSSGTALSASDNVALFKYVRLRLVVTGTAPTAASGTASIGFTNPCTIAAA